MVEHNLIAIMVMPAIALLVVIIIIVSICYRQTDYCCIIDD